MSGLYNRGAKLLTTGVSWEASDIRVLLVTVGYTPDPDHETVADVVSAGAELVGAGYARLALGGRSVLEDAVGDRVVLDAENTTFPSLGAAAGTPKYAVVYYNGGLTDADRGLLGWVELSGATTPSGADYLVTWGELGLFVLARTNPVVESTPEWVPIDWTAGVESDPNNYGTVSGDALGVVTFTADAALTANTLLLVGTTTTRPCAIDVPAPADWDPATEDLWLQIDMVDFDQGSNLRLGVGCGLRYSSGNAIGIGLYESSTGNAQCVVLSHAAIVATQSAGATAPDRVRLITHLFDRSGAHQMPVMGYFESDPPSAVSGWIGSNTGSTGLTDDPADYTLRCVLLHATGGTAVAGGEVISGRIRYARVPRAA